MLALGRFEGVAADRWVTAAWRHHRAPHRLVPAPDGVPAAPAFARRPARPPHRPRCASRSPGSAPTGSSTSAPTGWRVICRASAVTFSLRTPAEQEALVAGFARWLELARRAHPDPGASRAGRPHPDHRRPPRSRARPAPPRPGGARPARTPRSWPNWPTRRDLLRREVLVVLRQAAHANRPAPTRRAACSDGPAKPPRPSARPESPSPCSTARPRRRAWPVPSTRPAPADRPPSTAAASPGPSSRSPWPATRRAVAPTKASSR